MSYTVPRLSMPDFARKAAALRQAEREAAEREEREPIISAAPAVPLAGFARHAPRYPHASAYDHDRPRDPVVFGPHELHACGALVASTAGACWHCGRAVS